MVMIRCSDCSWLFHHRLVAVTIHVVLTGSDRLEGEDTTCAEKQTEITEELEKDSFFF